MKFYYDFHIHTALSPCGDEDMTPNNIVNMSVLNELDCIAITDHNAFENVEAILEVAKNTDLLVIPGMEAETSEEIHVVCLFPDLHSLRTFGDVIKERIPKIKNKPHIYGRQLIMNSEDEITGECDDLLIVATSVDIYELTDMVFNLGGIAIPAHIDRESNSIMTSLGYMPADLDVDIVEISKRSEPNKYMLDNKEKFKKNYAYIQSSDAHFLGDINERINYFEFEKKPNAAEVIDFLKNLHRVIT